MIAPPYDVINEEQKEQLYSSSEYNVCHIELPKGEGSDKYLHAKQLINSWINKEILLQENELTYYLYQQTFNLEGQLIKRRSILGLLEIHAFEDRIILPHENTMGGPKKDRYSLLEATQANISPIFCMCNDDNGNLFQLLENYSKNEPLLTSTDISETRHDLWKISDDQMFYCRQRGLDQENAVSLIVNGFCKEVLKELPMEFAVEAQKLLGISLEGSVG